MDLDSVADELYRLHPRDFIAARDARAKEAKAAGDGDAAREIARLRKPTVVAWLANQLALQRGDEIGQLLDLGAELRKATAALSGSKLRELSGQRRQVVQAMVQQARALARDAGQPVSESVARELEETLTAAMADQSAADQLREGHLAEGLEHTGFGTPGEVPKRPATGPQPATDRRGRAAASEGGRTAKPSAAERRRAERRERLDRELGEAWSAARQAADARAAADAAADAADKEAQSAQREVDRLRSALRESEQLLSEARDVRKKAASHRDIARRDAERATRRVSELQAQLEEV